MTTWEEGREELGTRLERSDCVEELEKKRDTAHHLNNWMKSERANLPLRNLKNVAITKRNLANGDSLSIEETTILRKLPHPNTIQIFDEIRYNELNKLW